MNNFQKSQQIRYYLTQENLREICEKYFKVKPESTDNLEISFEIEDQEMAKNIYA